MSIRPPTQRAIDALIAAGRAECSWEGASRLLADALGADRAALMAWDARTHEVLLDDGYGNSASLMQEYADEYWRHDLMVQRSTPPGTWMIDTEFLPAWERRANPLYGSLMPRYGLRQVLAASLHDGPAYKVALSLHRTSARDEGAQLFVDNPERRALTQAALYAFEMRYGRAQLAKQALEEALASVDTHPMLLDDDLRVSPLHQRPLPAGWGRLQVRRGLLRHAQAAWTRRIVQARRQALDTGAAACELPLGAGCMARLEMLPLPPHARGIETAQCLLLTVRVVPAGPPAAVELEALFGLTSAQAAVVAALCRGDSPKHIAVRTQRSLGTVRTHIAQALARTGQRRVPDLLRLVRTLD